VSNADPGPGPFVSDGRPNPGFPNTWHAEIVWCEKPMIKKKKHYSRTFAINEQLKSSPNGPCLWHWFYRITFLEHPSSYD